VIKLRTNQEEHNNINNKQQVVTNKSIDFIQLTDDCVHLLERSDKIPQVDSALNRLTIPTYQMEL
jgi:hypothetical protein